MTTIAIDGPGGSGKSTLARGLAGRLGCDWLDTGAMYRSVALAALRAGVDPGDGARLEAIARRIDLAVTDKVVLDGEDVTDAIRSPEVDAVVSVVAAHPAVRAQMVERQRAWVASRGGGVVEGRDITSVVLPDADVKVFLTAASAERAGRRAGQRPGADPGAVEAAIAARDALDSTRPASPLVVAEGAVVVDSTGKTPEEVLEEVVRLLPETPPTSSARQVARVVEVPPPTPGALRFYGVCRAIAVGASHVYYPGPVIGADRLPEEGPYVLAPVHRTNLDWLLAARVTRRRLRYIVKDEVWRRSRLAGRLLEHLGAFPVERAAADREALATALAVLQGGEPLVIFPEGTRRSGDRVAGLRDGAAYLALRAGVPIVPVGLGGMEASMPRGRVIPRPVRVAVVVGDPIDPADIVTGAGDGGPGRPGRVPRAATRALSERLRQALESVHAEAEAAVGGGRERT